MKSQGTIHILPYEGHWAVMTDERKSIQEGIESKEEAIKIAGQAAIDGKFDFMAIHNKDDLKPRRAA